MRGGSEPLMSFTELTFQMDTDFLSVGEGPVEPRRLLSLIHAPYPAQWDVIHKGHGLRIRAVFAHALDHWEFDIEKIEGIFFPRWALEVRRVMGYPQTLILRVPTGASVQEIILP